MNIDGNPGQLTELYDETEDPEEKMEIIDSFYKFETLPAKQKDSLSFCSSSFAP
mgnify:CR=1 FL=1